MFKVVFKSIFILLILLQAAFANKPPVGYWKTIDDKTGLAKAIVEIWQDEDKQLYGRVLKVYNPVGKIEVCTACEGDLYNKPIVGMIIMEHLKQQDKQPDLWSEGSILDPKNGKTYRCNLQLTENQQKLVVRGYLGVPLFGRTQTWQKVPDIAHV